jgi:hypothetical protein
MKIKGMGIWLNQDNGGEPGVCVDIQYAGVEELDDLIAVLQMAKVWLAQWNKHLEDTGGA